MSLRRYPIIAREGWPFIVVGLLLMMVATRVGGAALWISVGALLVILVLLFRDPRRRVPAVPLGVVAPVDGRILSIKPTDKGELRREAMMIEMTVNHFGAYMARSPAEGKVLDLRDNLAAGSRMTGGSGLWVRTDEGDDVVVLMVGVRQIAKPRSFVGYGERLGQGQRFAFIRLARRARIFLPLDCQLRVKEGQRVRAGSDLLAEFSRYEEDTSES
ncbi:MAG: phosphatidylserine decarboxylase [Gammaproteobacteria bacterium]